MTEEKTPWICAGCGKPAKGNFKSCDCITFVGSRKGLSGKTEYTVFEEPKCEVCGGPILWVHDHKPDQSGIDDGPPIRAMRRKPEPKAPDELRDIRARAWETRRQKYGPDGHR